MSMELRNCSRCGKLFRSTGLTICSECRTQLDEEFKIVRDYLRQHPGARVFEVSQATGVPASRIYNMVREGRLTATSTDSDLAVECIQCGTKIVTGRMCSKCTLDFKASLRPPASTKKSPSGSRAAERVHIADRRLD